MDSAKDRTDNLKAKYLQRVPPKNPDPGDTQRISAHPAPGAKLCAAACPTDDPWETPLGVSLENLLSGQEHQMRSLAVSSDTQGSVREACQKKR
jgi:hypothetical protein